MENKEPQEKKLNIEMSKEVSKGHYSNLAIISHSATEFILDFAQLFPGIPKAEIVSRVIMNPEHAKRLLFALQDNLQKYEKAHGEIRLQNQNAGRTAAFPLNGFGPNGPKA